VREILTARDRRRFPTLALRRPLADEDSAAGQEDGLARIIADPKAVRSRAAANDAMGQLRTRALHPKETLHLRHTSDHFLCGTGIF
jgi:hypothetical protein